MDNHITIRFFKIEPHHETTPSFADALVAAFALGDTPRDRQRAVSSALIRLERLTVDASFIDGEVVRRQDTALPPEATDSGMSPLPLSDGAGLGHPIAFRYSTTLGVLAIQFDNRAVSPGRFLAYLREVDPAANYSHLPLVRKDAWDRYGRGMPRKVSLKIANPNLHAVEGPVDSLKAASETLAEQFNAPMITIEISMGRKRGGLVKSLVDSTLRYWTEGAGREEDVRALKVDVDSESEALDFIEEKLVDRDRLDLPENNPAKHYARRQAAVKQAFNRHLTYITEAYGRVET